MAPGSGHGGIDPQWWQDNLPRVREFVTRRLRPELAQVESPSDIVQSACRELLSDLNRESQVRGGLAVLRWRFLRRALRKIVQKHRYHAAQKRRLGRAAGGNAVDAALDLALGPVARLVEAERAERLARAMQQLSIRHQRVIEWVHFDGMPHAEVGRRLGCSEDASKMLLSRAKARLAVALGDGSQNG
jgi:RNA polymerase sigma factor (sigma-70 family)